VYVNENVYVKKRVGVGRYINNLKKGTNILIMEYLLIYFNFKEYNFSSGEKY